jgi:hypothetical protein
MTTLAAALAAFMSLAGAAPSGLVGCHELSHLVSGGELWRSIELDPAELRAQLHAEKADDPEEAGDVSADDEESEADVEEEAEEGVEADEDAAALAEDDKEEEDGEEL